MQQFDGERAQLENNPLRSKSSALPPRPGRRGGRRQGARDDPEARLRAERLVQRRPTSCAP
jgi:hypothetical protein